MKKNQNNFFSEGLKYRKCINFNSKLCFNKECSKCKKFEITKGKYNFIIFCMGCHSEFLQYSNTMTKKETEQRWNNPVHLHL
jgi:hypothetical protein